MTASAVLLSFDGAPHRLEIPFEAVSVFADPSVEFGLQFGAAGRRRPAGQRRDAAAEHTRSAGSSRAVAAETGSAAGRDARSLS